ncbi:MAG: DUF2851 family protein, partial [Chthoniobacterales bacterium]
QQAIDIEIDLKATDWEAHGHRDNPDFNRVGIHFFQHAASSIFFTKNSENENIPQVRFALPAQPAPTKFFPLRDAPVESSDQALKLLRMAAMYRLHAKMRRLRASRHLHGDSSTLFQALSEGLGYKNNILPMLLLAGRLGVSRAVNPSAESLCFGIAGFLEAKKFQESESGERSYQRKLWEVWWKQRDDLSRLILPKTAWRLAGNRPANHPHRRVACLPLLAKKLPQLLKILTSEDAKSFRKTLGDLRHPFWDQHTSLSSRARRAEKKQALIGRSRADDLTINVFYPWKLMDQSTPEEIPETYFAYKATNLPRSIHEMATWFCPSLPDNLLRLVYIQQGLLQIHRDFRGVLPPREIAASIEK